MRWGSEEAEETMDIEGYIKDLSPELQEKARACKSVDELLALAKENSVAIPDEALGSIAGGQDSEVGNCNPSDSPCPKCGSTNVKCISGGDLGMCQYRCLDCENVWMG